MAHPVVVLARQPGACAVRVLSLLACRPRVEAQSPLGLGEDLMSSWDATLS